MMNMAAEAMTTLQAKKTWRYWPVLSTRKPTTTRATVSNFLSTTPYIIIYIPKRNQGIPAAHVTEQPQKILYVSVEADRSY